MRYFRIFIASLCLHGLLAYLVSFVPAIDLHRPEMKQQTYVDLLETPEMRPRPKVPALNEKTFVRAAPAPEKLLTKEKREKRFASEDEQTVLEEQKAQANGMTANRSSDSLQTKPRQSRKLTKKRAEKLDFSPTSPLERAKRELEAGNDLHGDMDVGPMAKKPEVAKQEATQEPSIPAFDGFERGISTLGSDLPDDIKFGSFTALNTDRHLYYSFYSRMEEAIRHRWETYVKGAIFEFETGSQKIQMKDRWTTKLEIVLDNRGNFEKAIMSEGSGVRSFDSAPVQAFRDAQHFPNPPAEMVKDDGKIHIYYAFTIDVVPRYATGHGRSRGDTAVD